MRKFINGLRQKDEEGGREQEHICIDILSIDSLILLKYCHKQTDRLLKIYTQAKV